MTDQPPLKLWGTVRVAEDINTIYAELTDELILAATEAVGARGVFHLALSGGSTPKAFYEGLTKGAAFRSIPWDQTHLWLVDERYVPLEDDRSNFKMIRQSLADHVPLYPAHVHPVPVDDQAPAERYERLLAEAFGMEPSTTNGDLRPVPALDFVILGMGDDGHTASLFPGSHAIGEKLHWIVFNDGPRVTPPPRVTMTYPLLNAANRIAVLVTGAKKRARLQGVDHTYRSDGPDPTNLPITGIQPMGGQITWYLDAAAAGATHAV